MSLGKRERQDSLPEEEDRAKKVKTYDLLDTQPFQLLITSPPIVYCGNYCALADYMHHLVSTDETTPDRFELGPLPVALLEEYGLYEDAQLCWRPVLEAIQSPASNYEDLWDRLVNVDEALCLAPEPLVSQKVLEYQQEVWWIKQVASWFDRDQNSVSRVSYQRIGFNALILEAFYRFVWARHTLLQLSSTSNLSSEDQEMTSDNAEPTNESESDPNSQEQEDCLTNLPERVDLFFCHSQISQIFDQVESTFFDSGDFSDEPNQWWDIEPAVDTFVQLVVARSLEFSKSSLQDEIVDTPTVLRSILADYVATHVPFLRKMGLSIDSQQPFVRFTSNS